MALRLGRVRTAQWAEWRKECVFEFALVAAAMQRIRDRISALEDRKRALLQDMISPTTGEKKSVDPKYSLDAIVSLGKVRIILQSTLSGHLPEPSLLNESSSENSVDEACPFSSFLWSFPALPSAGILLFWVLVSLDDFCYARLSPTASFSGLGFCAA
ncbi:hypothetical protein KY289_011292 [Solanum tuberosum]|nr:hypothetical protein KY289_011292 [Solanum tuberosum]